MDAADARRRVKAARAYAGLSVPDLAAEIGVGERTLRAMEGNAGRPFRLIELRAIAEACGVPRAWFELPFEWLDEAEVVVTGVDAHVSDADMTQLLADFAVKGGVYSVQSPPRTFSRTAYAVLERGGRIFWWTVRDGELQFRFARPMPGSGPEGMTVRSQAYVSLVALGDLLETWLDAARFSVDLSQRIAASQTPGNADTHETVEAMKKLYAEIRASVDEIVQRNVDAAALRGDA